ncbi:MAG TPA: hypothetical protein VGF39_06215 [Stellaceae bacterium]|jgi:hypothetical protein
MLVRSPTSLRPGPAGIVLPVLRLVTLACAGVMVLSPNSYDRINALGLVAIALARP